MSASQSCLEYPVPAMPNHAPEARRARVANGHLRRRDGEETDVTTPLRSRPAWAELAVHHDKIKDVHLRELFAADPGRGERLTAQAAGLFLDYSKNRVTDETLALLFELANQSG